MFKIAKNPQFTHAVTVLVPVDGGHEEQTLKVRYRARSVGDLNQHDHMTAEGIEAFLRAIVIRFEDVVDEAGEIVPSDEALTDTMLSLPFVRMAVVQGYYAAVNKARLGN